ncbi:hypothetical protein PInf_017078 [Phytophthora infestans]|nr:hypothetical protein PInf_017078 [Phytophthora infestans]
MSTNVMALSGMVEALLLDQVLELSSYHVKNKCFESRDAVVYVKHNRCSLRMRWEGRTQSLVETRAKPAFKTKQQFKRAVEMHLDWSNRIPTPFVTLFGTREHAVKWAKSHFELGYDDDPDFHNDEFLVLRKIPRRSIIRETYLSCAEGDSSDDSVGRSSEEASEEDDVFSG